MPGADSTDVTTGFTPYVVNPGQSVTIPVTITPAGKAGTVVSGTVYVADSSLITGPLAGTEGTDVAAFPYSYTISS